MYKMVKASWEDEEYERRENELLDRLPDVINEVSSTLLKTIGEDPDAYRNAVAWGRAREVFEVSPDYDFDNDELNCVGSIDAKYAEGNEKLIDEVLSKSSESVEGYWDDGNYIVHFNLS